MCKLSRNRVNVGQVVNLLETHAPLIAYRKYSTRSALGTESLALISLRSAVRRPHCIAVAAKPN